ncbi:MAG TPA: response regulator [Methylomirabilota bacterium]|jgi:DNA-binding NtrC family response regulator
MSTTKTPLARVLVIDDDADTREVLSVFLAHQGYRPALADGGREGLKLAVSEPPDVVLLDVMMPDVNGLDVLGRLRLLHPALPVIMTTASSDPDVAREALRLGAFRYLRKPIDLDGLDRVIEEALSVPKRSSTPSSSLTGPEILGLLSDVASRADRKPPDRTRA